MDVANISDSELIDPVSLGEEEEEELIIEDTLRQVCYFFFLSRVDVMVCVTSISFYELNVDL